MKKFNGFENWFIQTAIDNAVAQAEEDVSKASKDGVNLIYAPGYFTQVGKEIKGKVDDLTLKKALDEKRCIKTDN